MKAVNTTIKQFTCDAIVRSIVSVLVIVVIILVKSTGAIVV